MKQVKHLSWTFIALCVLASCSGKAVTAHRADLEIARQSVNSEFGKTLTGRVTVDGQPRRGVVVSDGVNVIATDNKGEYKMHTKGRQHVFISVPEDCEIPVSNGLPYFYRTIDSGDSTDIRRDFELVSTPKKSVWTLFTMADPQIGSEKDLAEYKEMLPRMAEFTSTLPGAVYGIGLGDLVWNTPQYFSTYATTVPDISVPVFSVIGNHDHNENVKNDTDSDREFRDALGPTYYSVNIGDCHLIVLDDILYSGIKNRNDYSGTLTDAQLEWLRKDLSYVDHDKTLIIGLHIPTQRRNAP